MNDDVQRQPTELPPEAAVWIEDYLKSRGDGRVNETLEEALRSAASEPNSIAAVLAERGERYGEFEQNAAIAQELKDIMHGAPMWRHLSADKCEALHQIASKISRILSGDPEYRDNWSDISGYAELVARTLEHVE